MLRKDKERIVGELAERLKGSQNLLVADYRGLTMTEIDELRTKLLETGARFSDVEVKRLATLPPADVLRAQLVGAVAGPVTTIVGLFAAPLRDLVNVLDARIKQLEEQGDTPEPQGETPEPVAEAEPEAAAEPAESEPAAEATEPEQQEPSNEAPSAEGEEPSAETEEEE